MSRHAVIPLAFLSLLLTLYGDAYSNGNENGEYSSLIVVNADEAYVSADGVTWYRADKKVVFHTHNDFVHGVYTIRYRLSNAWYQCDVVVGRGHNVVDVLKVPGIQNYGLERDRIVVDGYGESNCVRGYINGHYVEISLDELRKILTKDFSYYILVFSDKYGNAKEILSKYANEKDVVLAIVPKQHWWNNGDNDLGALVIDSNGNSLRFFQGSDVDDVIRQSLSWIRSPRLPGLPDFVSVDYLVFIVVCVLGILVLLRGRRQ